MTAAWWSAGTSVEAYTALGNPLEWQLAYPELFERMGFGNPLFEGPVLDYGCGPGKVAAHLAERYGYDVVGCDVSTEMIALAKRDNATPRTTFTSITKPVLEEYPSEYFGAAICTFVLCVLGMPKQHVDLVREVRRLLRPGAPFGLIVPHPDSSGVQFSTCRSGDPDVTYHAGDPMTTRLTAGGTDLTIQDFFWPTEWYRSLLEDNGFSSVTAYAPLPKDPAEPDRAPFLIVAGRR
ncbi:class I SAM-dependent methyltransferase [Streptomyces violaceorubidus]|uniref:Class I SAM-dependent methyltransferase n=1 Tax=Streptomyces violaceorubidus TaxID=284042 RepID=A0ABV1T725_9ACTN